MELRLQPTKMNRKQGIHDIAVTVLSLKFELLKDLIAVFKSNHLQSVENRNKALDYFEFLVECIIRNEDRLTQQEIQDIQNEMGRYDRMTQLFKIAEAPRFAPALRNEKVRQLHENLTGEIFSIKTFTKDVDGKV